MTPVYQSGRDDCYEACVASIVDLPLAQVPRLSSDRGWVTQLRAFCRELGHDCQVSPGDGRPLREARKPGGYSIVSHQVMNGDLHAAVLLEGQLVHDPSPRPFCTLDCIVVMWTTFWRL
jgi:hypothetical protein